MRNSVLLAAASLIIAVLVFSCKKELSFEAGEPAQGSLQSSSGNCLPKTVNGTYRVNQSLGDTNSIDVTVSVTQTGSYSISTDTINGYSFKGIGTFGSTGTVTVHLQGYGKPIATGVNAFTVKFDSTACIVTVPVVAAIQNNTAFTLQGNGSSCMNATVAGTYTQSTTLNSSNTVAIQVNVTTAGAWTMGTNTVTGFSFAGAGTFTGTGVQTIILTGSGTPTTSGIQTFTVSAGATTCTFTVNVKAGTSTTTTPPSTDHFILTDNSWWSYSTPLSNDTLKRQIIGSATASGFTYKAMKEKDLTTQIYDDTLYFRKSGNNYWEYNFVDWYTTFYFDNSSVDSILMMKEGLTTGATWSSSVYTGTVQGQSAKLRYDFTCANANATVTYNGQTFTNVYQIVRKAMVDYGSGYVTDVTYTNYYAQGVGWIFTRYDDGTNVYDFPLRYYQVF